MDKSCFHAQNLSFISSYYIAPKTLYQYFPSFPSSFCLFVYIAFCFHLTYFNSHFTGFKVSWSVLSPQFIICSSVSENQTKNRGAIATNYLQAICVTF